jgi:hypothetical protein
MAMFRLSVESKVSVMRLYDVHRIIQPQGLALIRWNLILCSHLLILAKLHLESSLIIQKYRAVSNCEFNFRTSCICSFHACGAHHTSF